MDVRIEESWKEQLAEEFSRPYFEQLVTFVRNEYMSGTPVYPPAKLIFNAFDHCPFNNVKVVILGQDPYHEEGQAHGMCFSVLPGVDIPPSLKNIYKEIEAEYGFVPPNHGCLVSWSNQGVLLLNTTLTVREHQANSHSKFGWQKFTDRIIQEVNKQEKPVVFILWGGNARSKKAFIDSSKHLVLESAHPSPLSAWQGFFGNNHFKKTNEFLKLHGREEINWKIENL